MLLLLLILNLLWAINRLKLLASVMIAGDHKLGVIFFRLILTFLILIGKAKRILPHMLRNAWCTCWSVSKRIPFVKAIFSIFNLLLRFWSLNWWLNFSCWIFFRGFHSWTFRFWKVQWWFVAYHLRIIIKLNNKKSKLF